MKGMSFGSASMMRATVCYIPECRIEVEIVVLLARGFKGATKDLTHWRDMADRNKRLGGSSMVAFAIQVGALQFVSPAPFRLPLVLGLCASRGLPLHVTRIVSAATGQRLLVIDHVTGAGAA